MSRSIEKSVSRTVWENSTNKTSKDTIACETPVALVYNGISHIVMMVTPNNLEDFAYGISYTENIIGDAKEIYDIEVDEIANGIEVKINLSSKAFAGLKNSRRNLIGATGCGICGRESLEQFNTPSTDIKFEGCFRNTAIQNAISNLSEYQDLNSKTGSVHGAAWCDEKGNIIYIREDVGRHNALDKLIGLLLRKRCDKRGFVIVTSRASFEMVTKVAVANIPLLVAVSAPTSMAVEVAEKAGVALVGFARPNRHVIYSNQSNFIENY